MKSIKFYRAVVMIMAILTGSMGVAMMLFPSEAIEYGVTDKMFGIAIGMFLIYTLMWMIVDSTIKERESKSEAYKRMYSKYAMQGTMLLLIAVIVGGVMLITTA